MLSLGYKTAHTAYTDLCFTHAQVIADTPIFCDYKTLNTLYPNAKFIYLERDLTAWLPSIKQLLQRMFDKLIQPHGGFNPHLKRAYSTIFQPLNLANINDDKFLSQCYLKHQQSIIQYFADAPSKLLAINLADGEQAFKQLIRFLAIQSEHTAPHNFPHLNQGGKVIAWNKIRHPLKVESTRNGKVDKLGFLTANSS